MIHLGSDHNSDLESGKIWSDHWHFCRYNSVMIHVNSNYILLADRCVWVKVHRSRGNSLYIQCWDHITTYNLADRTKLPNMLDPHQSGLHLYAISGISMTLKTKWFFGNHVNLGSKLWSICISISLRYEPERCASSNQEKKPLIQTRIGSRSCFRYGCSI